MQITITATGFSLDGPLVAGEKVAVSVSGITFAEDSTPTLALLARFPDALLASVELAEDAQTPGTWTGELDTATKQTALFFATARADERRDAVLELVDPAGRRSVARLTVPFANSALCPSPFGAKDESPVYIPVPGPPGQQGEQGPAGPGPFSYNQTPTITPDPTMPGMIYTPYYRNAVVDLDVTGTVETVVPAYHPTADDTGYFCLYRIANNTDHAVGVTTSVGDLVTILTAGEADAILFYCVDANRVLPLVRSRVVN